MGTATLEYCDTEIAAATEEDVARALEHQPRDDDWYITITRDNDDWMDVVIDEGKLEVRCQEGGKICQPASVVDDAALKEMMLSFLRGDDAWRNQATWTEPAPPPSASFAKSMPLAGWFGIVFVSLLLLFALLGRRDWFVWLFVAAFPAVIVMAVVTKLGEVRRAATWKPATARILRSELVTQEHKGKTVKLPAVEYEFTIALNPVRGHRISIGEIMPDSPEVQRVLERYRVGTSVPVYYNPADPRESVLERDLPPGLRWLQVFIGKKE